MNRYRIVHGKQGKFKVQYRSRWGYWYELNERGDLSKGTNSFVKIKHARNFIIDVERDVILTRANKLHRGKTVEVYGDEELKVLLNTQDQEQEENVPRADPNVAWGRGMLAGAGIELV